MLLYHVEALGMLVNDVTFVISLIDSKLTTKRWLFWEESRLWEENWLVGNLLMLSG